MTHDSYLLAVVTNKFVDNHRTEGPIDESK